MIRCEYKLVDDQGVTKLEYYTNDAFGHLDNAVYIEGPNNSGKSTILHIIALSCFGLKFKEKKISEELVSKLEWLIDPQTNVNIEFKLHISMDTIDFTAEKQLKSAEIRRKLNGKNITFERFREKFDLIYDIPTNPTERLEEIINSAENSIYAISPIIDGHGSFVKDTLDLIRQDPVKKANEIKNRIKSILETQQTSDNKLTNLKSEYTDIKKFATIIHHAAELDKLKQLKKKKDALKSKVGSKKAVKNISDNTTIKVQSFNNNYLRKNSFFIDLISNSLISEKNILNEIKNLAELDVLDDIKNNTGVKYWDILLNIEEIIIDLDDKVIDEDASKNVEYLTLLRSTLKAFPINLSTNESFTSVIKVLKDEIDKYVNCHSDFDMKIEFDKVREEIHKIRTQINEGEKLYLLYNELSKLDQEKIDLETDYDYLAKLEFRIKESEGTIRNLKQNYKALKIDQIHDIDSYIIAIRNKYGKISNKNITELEIYIGGLEESIKTEKKNNESIITKIEANKLLLTEIEQKQKSEFVEHESFIEKTYEGIENLKRLFNVTFIDYIKNLKNGSSVSDKREEYFRLGMKKYLAKKIPTIPIQDNNTSNIIDVEVESINMKTKIITTKDGRSVDYRGYGSGITASLSITSKINMLNKKKVSILLLDEVFAMDDISLKPIKKSITQLYNQKKLLAGIIAQKSSTISVQPLIEHA